MVHIGRGMSPAELALKACEKVLRQSKLSPPSVDAIIVHHTLFMLSLEPRTLVGELQHKLGLSRAVGFAVSGQGCASVVAALIMARNMIRAGAARNVMVVGTDSLLGSLEGREIYDSALVGEGASAVVVEEGRGPVELTESFNYVNGATFDSKPSEKGFQLAYFFGCAKVIREVLRRASISMKDVCLLLPHNINKSSWNFILSHVTFVDLTW
jgi:3-oxoacyl-[acyl-carrier-protein] synthase-3